MATFTESSNSAGWRTYNLRIPIRSYFWEAVRGESIIGGRKPTPPLAEMIGEIKGIQSFYVREGYELIIHKAEAYSWAEIEPKLHEMIDSHNLYANWPVQAELETASVSEEPSDFDDFDEDEAA